MTTVGVKGLSVREVIACCMAARGSERLDVDLCIISQKQLKKVKAG